jgi:hypothetical protein
MKRITMMLAACGVLAAGVMTVAADAHTRPHHPAKISHAIVVGVVTAAPTLASPDQFTANARVAKRGKAKAALTSVTITTNGSTKFDINGNRSATVSGIAVGEHFIAKFAGSKTDTLTELVATPALAVRAHTPGTKTVLYAFLGKVTATDSSSNPETITVDVTRSTPKGLFTGTDTFDVKSVGKIVVGDVVDGGTRAASGLSAATIEGQPLNVVINHGLRKHHRWDSKGAWNTDRATLNHKAKHRNSKHPF